MSERIFVYVPMDEDFEHLEFTYNARTFVMKPNAVNELLSPWPEIPPSRLLAACLEQLGRFGVVQVSSDIDDDENKAAAARAEDIHEMWLRGVDGKVLADFKVEQEKARDLGLVPITEDQAPARVKKAVKRLREWGVIPAALVLAILSAWMAQPVAAQVLPRVVTAKLDLDATAVTYFAFEALERDGGTRLKTSGSTTTVTAENTATETPFADIAVNDQLIIRDAAACSTGCLLTVSARASATSITVSDAIDLTVPAHFKWRKMRNGTAVTDGWFETGRPGSIDIAIPQAVLTGGVNVHVQCAAHRADGTYRPRQVYPPLIPPAVTATYVNFGTFGATSGMTVSIPETWYACRVGLYTTTDDGGDLTTNQEQITIVFTPSFQR